MTPPPDEAHEHFEAARMLFDQMTRTVLGRRDEQLLSLLHGLRKHCEQAFWLARLEPRVTLHEIAATPYCRNIPLTPTQAQNRDFLQRGMHEAERSLAPAWRAAPWNALFAARRGINPIQARNSFEAGFLIRLYQRLQQACAERERES